MNLNSINDHLEKLNSFRIIANVGSISGAAKSLNTSQSTLSHNILALEDALDVKLLDRKPRGVSLTKKGKILFEFSNRLYLDIKTVESKMKSTDSKRAAHIKIATHETLAIHVWPSFLSHFKKKYPEIHISLFSGRIDQIMDGVREKNYNFALTVEPYKSPDIEKVKIYSGDFGLYVTNDPTNFKLLEINRKRVTSNDLKSIPIITDNHAHIREGYPIPKFLAEHGLNSTLTYEVNSFETAIRLASKGLGIAVVPTRNAKEAVAQKVIRKLKVSNINEKKFGAYGIYASYKKSDANNEVIKLLSMELNLFFKMQK